jgi:hypothetical protein
MEIFFGYYVLAFACLITVSIHENFKNTITPKNMGNVKHI